jgi:hypothetical protein
MIHLALIFAAVFITAFFVIKNNENKDDDDMEFGC